MIVALPSNDEFSIIVKVDTQEVLALPCVMPHYTINIVGYFPHDYAKDLVTELLANPGCPTLMQHYKFCRHLVGIPPEVVLPVMQQFSIDH